MHRQMSAPTLCTASIRESGDYLPSSVNSNWQEQEEYTPNNPKFMGLEPNVDMLLGELDNVLSLDLESNPIVKSNCIDDKRNIFATQRSATSVIEQAQQSQQVPAWFNRSCPDFSHNMTPCPTMSSETNVTGTVPMTSMLNQLQEVMEEDEEDSLESDEFIYPNIYQDWHHSTPNLFSSVEESRSHMNRPELPMPSSPTKHELFHKQRPNLRMLSPKKRSQSVRQINLGAPSSFSVYHSPEKNPNNQHRINHEDIVLSPIGDGKADDLFDKLIMIQEFVDDGDESINIPF